MIEIHQVFPSVVAGIGTLFSIAVAVTVLIKFRADKKTRRADLEFGIPSTQYSESTNQKIIGSKTSTVFVFLNNCENYENLILFLPVRYSSRCGFAAKATLQFVYDEALFLKDDEFFPTRPFSAGIKSDDFYSTRSGWAMEGTATVRYKLPPLLRGERFVIGDFIRLPKRSERMEVESGGIDTILKLVQSIDGVISTTVVRWEFYSEHTPPAYDDVIIVVFRGSATNYKQKAEAYVKCLWLGQLPRSGGYIYWHFDIWRYLLRLSRPSLHRLERIETYNVSAVGIPVSNDKLTSDLQLVLPLENFYGIALMNAPNCAYTQMSAAVISSEDIVKKLRFVYLWHWSLMPILSRNFVRLVGRTRDQGWFGRIRNIWRRVANR